MKGNLIGSGGPMRTLALLGLVAAMQLGAADPRVGYWTLSSADSAIDPPGKISITPVGNQIHVVTSGETRVDFTADGNGHATPVKGIPGFNQIEWRRIGKNQVEIQEMKDGLLAATLREKLSSDHNELTVTTSRKGRADQISVWVRTGGVKVPANPFAGEWTQDLTKSRLRQGLVVKIETDGKDGVRFSGEFNYTADFDGKDYILTNSNNDTVTLILVDANTVESIYKRGDQIAERDRWVVSPEGKQMTVTKTGMRETGQQVKEKLVYRKQ
jgi:hypothetical protein